MANFLAIISVLSMVGCFATVAGNQCMCAITHPQQNFCESDFVFTATIKSIKTMDGYMVYKMKVSQEKVFKGEEYINRGKKFIKVYTPFGTSLCGRPNLANHEKYLISGMMKNGRMEISLCTWVEEWKSLTPEQIKYLKKGTYARGCESCKISSVHSAHYKDLNANSNSFDASQISGIWSRYNCAYNPVASVKFLGNDCEDQFAYCTRDVVTDTCMWKSNDSYNECFNMRETAYALSLKRAPAFTHREQCRTVPRRLRRKCFKAMKKLEEAAGTDEIVITPSVATP